MGKTRNQLIADALKILHTIWALFIIITLISGLFNKTIQIINTIALSISVFAQGYSGKCPITIWENYYRKKDNPNHPDLPFISTGIEKKIGIKINEKLIRLLLLSMSIIMLFITLKNLNIL